jgi:type I restriction enzyme R subunit
VLDAAMNSMTKFKQIIGRGTRINKDFHKYYFTIMDFSGATRLFADPTFDGEPVIVSTHALGEKGYNPAEEIDLQTVRPEDIHESNPQEEILLPLGEEEEKKSKRIISEGVTFNVIDRIVQIIDPATGKLTTESLTRYAADTLASTFTSLDGFLQEWNKDIKKEEIIKTLEEKGVVFDELRKEMGDEDLDEFDIILHLAFGKKPLTRSERAKNISKENLFSKYEGRARQVIEILIERYSTQGILSIDDTRDLGAPDFRVVATDYEILTEIFNGRNDYVDMLAILQKDIYRIYE